MLYSKNCVHAGETKINPNGISEKNKTLNYYLLFFTGQMLRLLFVFRDLRHILFHRFVKWMAVRTWGEKREYANEESN